MEAEEYGLSQVGPGGQGSGRDIPYQFRQAGPDRSAELADRMRAQLRTVPNFPKDGVQFRDIGPVVGSADLFHDCVEWLTLECAPWGPTHVAAIESRGFILGGALALALGVGFVPVRKAGKLPPPTISREYSLEYSAGTLEIGGDAVGQGHRVVVLDDVLATGGTAVATCDLIERLGAKVVGCAFLLELVGLGGVQQLGDRTMARLLAL